MAETMNRCLKGSRQLEKRHGENDKDSPYMLVLVGMCERVAIYPALRAYPRPLHMQGIVAIPRPQSPFTMVTPTTLCLHPSMRLRSMGIRETECVCVGRTEREGKREWSPWVKDQNLWLQRDMLTDTHSKILITLSPLNPLEQPCLCGCCSSLLGLFGSRSGGH